MMKILLILLVFTHALMAQNLMNERIRKLPDTKKSIYLDKGIFHFPSKLNETSLMGIRNSYIPSRKYERIVIDFKSDNLPGIYGYIEPKDQKLYLDFFGVKLSSQVQSLKNTKFIKNVDFFNIDAKSLSVEISQKTKVNYDIFVLEKPARLVIDIVEAK